MEQFKSSKSSAKPTPSISPAVATGGAGLTAITAVQGAGGMTITSCPPDDTSFYCKFVKWFNMFKMLLVVLSIVITIGIIAYVFWPKKGKLLKKRK